MHKLVPKRFREYETVLILAPAINQTVADTVTKKIQDLLGQYEGKLTKVSLWGLRKLAYRIKKYDKGIYYQLNFVAPQGFVEEMEKHFRLNDNILRYLTVKTSELPIDPSAVVVKSTDVEFGLIEGLSEISVPPVEPPEEFLSEEVMDVEEDAEAAVAAVSAEDISAAEAEIAAAVAAEVTEPGEEKEAEPESIIIEEDFADIVVEEEEVVEEKKEGDEKEAGETKEEEEKKE